MPWAGFSISHKNAGNALLDLAERYGDVNAQMQDVAMGGALALEDSLG